MARINIESEIFRDKRFINLTIKTGSLESALGSLVMAWVIAQDYWRYSDNGIPKTEWIRQDLNNELISCGLAEDFGDFVKIRGSEKHFGWIRERVASGKKGGVSKSLSFSPSSAKLEGGSAKPLTLPLTLNTEIHMAEKSADKIKFNFEEIYEAYPKRDGDQGKGKGIAKLKRSITTEEDYQSLLKAVNNYNKYCAGKGWIGTSFVKQFLTFVNSDWKEWTSQTHSVNINPETLEKLRALRSG